MDVAIIGCGLIGNKRALALEAEDNLIACCDNNKIVTEEFSKKHNCTSYPTYKELIEKADIDVLIVAVINKYAFGIIKYGLENNINVLAEKPLGRNSSESSVLVKLAEENGIILKTGFNHRFHPALWMAKDMLDKDEIGKPMIIRARYGHGGRSGMEKEWRASKDLCGGGELLDQGVHIIDLTNWFAGKIKSVFGKVKTTFWEMEVEDNAFAYMESESGVNIQFHVSWTNWKNIFSFEIFGTEGYLRIEGLGGSYGPESLEFGKRKPEGGKPDIQTFDFPPEDISWLKEWIEFKSSIRDKRMPIGSGIDGHNANLIIDAIYRSSGKGCIIEL